ncbi:MAG: sulfatase-like hydrolase/transferase [Hyphomonas sp.]
MSLLRVSLLALLSLTFWSSWAHAERASDRGPNFVIILMDDMGWADLGVQDPRGSITPNMDALAQDGIRLTDFSVPHSVCTPSRAALLTGRYPIRNGLTGVVFPESRVGLPQSEVTLAEALVAAGYRTGYFGKWHLGHLPEFLPVRQGFETFNGMPFSNDMAVYARYEGSRIVDFNPDQRFLTRILTEATVGFIDDHKDEPFLAVLSHPMPHVPLFVSPEFDGVSGRGLYGDVIAELDWSVGAIRTALDERGLTDDTIIVLLSDNGPWLAFANHGGLAEPLREGKFSSYEGGLRVPALAAWPGHFTRGRVLTKPVSSLDIVPTFADLAKVDTSALPPLDGVSQARVWLGAKEEDLGERVLVYWEGDKISGIRKGEWKLVLPGKERLPRLLAIGWPGAVPANALSLYKIVEDISERRNLVGEEPSKVEELQNEIAVVEALLKSQKGQLPRPLREADLGVTDDLLGAVAPLQTSQEYRKRAIELRRQALGLSSAPDKGSQ